jgi:hypothetical protein
MSDGYKFDIDDVGPDAESNEGMELDADSLGDGFSYGNLVLFPLTIFAVYAFIAKSTVVGALTSLFGGASGLAMAVGTAAWVIGGIVVAFLGLMAVATAVLLLVGMVTRSGGKFALGMLGAIYFGAGYAGATYLFGYLPLLVGFMMTTTLMIWGLVAVVGGIAIIGAIIIT